MSNATSMPLRRGPLDELEAAARRVDAVAGHEMGDLEPHAGALGRAERLGHRLVGTLVAPPRVRRVDRVAAAADLAHRDELVLVGAALRCVLEARRVAPRTLLERLVEQVPHLRQLVVARRAVGETDDREPDLPVRREARHVDRRRGLLESFEVARRRRPGERDVGGVPVDRLRRELLVEEREAAEAAVADDLERDALVDGARGARVDEEREVGVAVDVDEAGRDDLARGVDLARRLGHVADRLTIRSPFTPTSARSGSAPVPSTTRPFRIARSTLTGALRAAAVASSSTAPSSITTP